MGTETKETIIFRPMTRADIPWVQELDLVSFSDQWSRGTWYEELISSIAYYLVMEQQGEPLGYAGLWFVACEGQVTRVAIKKHLRGQGLGKILTENLIAKAKQLGAVNMTLEVRASNIPAQKVYLATGFKNMGVRPHYYRDNDEDAIIMALEF